MILRWELVAFADKLAKKYSNLFSLPSKWALVAELFLLGTVVGLIAYAITPSSQGPLFGIVDGFVSLAFGSLLCTFMIHKVIGNGILTFRRTSALTGFGIALIGLGMIAAAIASRVLADPTILERTYFIACGIIVAYGYIVLGVTTELRQKWLFISSLLQPVTILIIHSILIYVSGFISKINFFTYSMAFILMAIISYALGRWYYSSIENVGREILGYGSLALFRAFINALMLDKTGLLEKMLKILAVRGDVEVRTFSFSGSETKGVVVAPMIHPGPFRDLGSSTLPTRIAQTFLDKQVMPMVFHTPTTHEKDLVLAKDCERVIQRILSVEGDGGVPTATQAMVRKRGAVTVTCQIFDKTPLVVITRSPLPTEDLPDRIHEVCMEKILENGYSDGVVVDAHNVMETAYTEFSEQDERDLIEAMVEALRGAEGKGESKVFAGFANAKVEHYSKGEGIGDAGIMALVTEVDGQKAAYVAIDGNNMVVGLREKIQVVLKKAGFDPVEVTTTDTHVVVALKAGEGYAPLGKAIPEGVLIEKILETVKEADSKKAECLVKFSKRKVEDVYLLGYKGIENLWHITDETIKAAKRKIMGLIGALIVAGIVVYVVVR
jgi:putative membrane protein